MRHLTPIARGCHGLAAAYNLLFVYTDLHAWAYGFTLVQYVSMPLLIVSGALLVYDKRQRAKTIA